MAPRKVGADGESGSCSDDGINAAFQAHRGGSDTVDLVDPFGDPRGWEHRLFERIAREKSTSGIPSRGLDESATSIRWSP
jgi:hypothetical protein